MQSWEKPAAERLPLINLIPRFYEPTKGEVRIDDIPVQNFRLSDLRKQIGLATQDVLLYSDTIEGNIAYGDSSIDLEEVEKFAKYSAASDFISKMPEGYDTVVGERGVGLSGGQKQRISWQGALAVRPSILILDDTTSAVDMETENRFRKHCGIWIFSCTKVIIAQRISTTMMADKILVMQHGRITEMGNHEELMAKKKDIITNWYSCRPAKTWYRGGRQWQKIHTSRMKSWKNRLISGICSGRHPISKKYRRGMILAIVLSGIGGAFGYVAPMIIQRALDIAVPDKKI